MSISAKYNPAEVEDKWYQYWLNQQYFSAKANPEKEPYCIVIPPPNVTGVLHMGHMLNNTIQDVLVRKARMEGKEACWVPGTDHASIATEAKVVAMLKERGIDKDSLSREDFLKYAWEWKEKYGGIILEQLKKLGASCDWSRTRFTMEPEMSEQVIKVFVDLYNKGYIYRGMRMVNWDPQGKTALSDDEVIYKEVNSKLYYLTYKIEGSDETITIATVRPETILGDTAICVHPEDDRYKQLVGKKALVPLIDRPIPIIADEYVDREFGTGALKITPAHDPNDYELGLKHDLEVIDILNDNGTLNEKAQLFIGEDRFVARKKIAKELEEKGYLTKVEDYKSNVGHSERTDAVIEPKISLQWFLKMDTITKPALENVMNDTVQLHPAKFKNMYNRWMENVRDWCVSRQLWWGQRIPAYYIEDTREFVVAETDEEALELARKKTGRADLPMNALTQDPDVLDTWFSSWLWPMSVFNGISNPEGEDCKYFYPTNDLVTAPEILFFWVARMIIAGYEYEGEKPFSNVYLTGIVRDKQGRKMSKSLGNSPDPLNLIAHYGADGVRTGMLFSSPAGNDLLFDEKLCEQGRNFNNKIWNAFRLIKGWEVSDSATQPEGSKIAIQWFKNRFAQAVAELEDHFKTFRISDALHTVYKLAWDDFCSWYLEMVKPPFGEPIDAATYAATIDLMEQLVSVLHPFMPFITEEIWQNLRERKEGESLCVSQWPSVTAFDEKMLKEASVAFEVIQNVRNLRNSKGLSPKEALELQVRTSRKPVYEAWENIISKLANLSSLNFVSDKPEGSSFVIEGDECAVPMAGNIDVEAERENLQKELDYTRGFLASVDKKLSNERFVNGAPEKVIDMERKKKADAEAKIKSLEESLASL